MKNSIKIRKIDTEKFILIDNEKKISIDFKIIEEKIKKDGEIIKINHWISLPDNSINRKGFRLEDFEKENEVEYFERKTPEFSEKLKYDFESFLTEDEKLILEELKEKSRIRYEEKLKKLENPIYKELDKNIKEIEKFCKEYNLIPDNIPKYLEAKKKLEELKI